MGKYSGLQQSIGIVPGFQYLFEFDGDFLFFFDFLYRVSGIYWRQCDALIGVDFSSFATVKYGVPQGSIVGPMLFSFNMLALVINIICRHGVSPSLFC